MKTRAKFECTDVTIVDDIQSISLLPVIDGSEEKESFFKYTPGGEINLGVVNPDVKFEVGEEYYVDFTKVNK